ncbi:hypothetical protein Tco_0431269 [Tanacetum coccineum]
MATTDKESRPHAAATFMANLMQTGPSTRQGTSNDTDFHSEVQTYDNHFFDNMHLQVSQEIHGGEQLDSDVDSVIDDHDNTIPYHQYQLNNEVESVPTDVSSVIPGGISVITILDDLRSQLAGHIKTNEEQSFANDSLKAELERYKTQVQNLEQSKVKKDLEQLVFEQSEKLKADKNALEESYLEELVWLRNTNKVVTELLQSYGQPVQIVPMLSKRPTFSTKDLHKSALGYRNLMYLKSSQLCHPTLYLGDVIVDPVHTPFRLYDSEETLVQTKVSRTKMLERMKDPLCKVSSKPINYAKLNHLYDTFVPQKQLSSEQVYWLPANEVASYNCNQSKPITTFVRTRPTKSQVYTQLKMLKACFPEFDKVIKDRTTPSYITNGEWHFEHTKKCFVEEIIPFYEKLKTHVKGIQDNLFKEVSEYMKIFDELDKKYDQCVTDKKSLEIENKNLLIQNECLLAQSMSKDICSVVLTSDIAEPINDEPRSNWVKEHSRNLELEDEILKLKDQLQGKDDLLKKLKAQISNMKEVSADSNLKSNSNVSSRASIPEKPKVLAPGVLTKPKVVPIEKSGSVSTREPANNVIVTPRVKVKTTGKESGCRRLRCEASQASVKKSRLQRTKTNKSKEAEVTPKTSTKTKQETSKSVNKSKGKTPQSDSKSNGPNKAKEPVESNKSLKIESEKLKADNNALEESYLEEKFGLKILPQPHRTDEPRSNCDKNTPDYGTKELELKFQKYKECLKNPQVCNNSSSLELNVFFELNKLKDQLQGKDDLMRKLKAQIGNMKEDENVSIKKRYQDLYQSKAESNSNVSSRAVVPKKPKVLAPGLYAMTPKYVPPQKRTIGIKYVTEASKSKSKCEKKTHRNLPARSENVKRVDNPLRNLNKRNHCGVKNLNSVNAKNPKVKNDAIVKQVWKATGKIFASVGSKWRPTEEYT